MKMPPAMLYTPAVPTVSIDLLKKAKRSSVADRQPSTSQPKRTPGQQGHMKQHQIEVTRPGRSRLERRDQENVSRQRPYRHRHQDRHPYIAARTSRDEADEGDTGYGCPKQEQIGDVIRQLPAGIG